MIVAGNTARRMGGFFGWGQFQPNHTDPTSGTIRGVKSMAPGMQQQWLDNEVRCPPPKHTHTHTRAVGECPAAAVAFSQVLDENGVRNYMSMARHTEAGARLRNLSNPAGGGPAEQSVGAMGRYIPPPRLPFVLKLTER